MILTTPSLTDITRLLLSNTGRHAEALAEAKRSRELNPLDLAQNALEGQFLLHAGRTDEALIQLRKTSRTRTQFLDAAFYRGERVYRKRNVSRKPSPNHAKNMNFPAEMLFRSAMYALAKSGKRREAQGALKSY